MATNPAVPFWDEGNTITAQASAAVTGKRFVEVTGPRVADQVQVGPATAAGRSFGVAGFDAAVGQLVTVYSSPGLVMPVTASGAIAAGDDVEVAAGGMAAAAAAGEVVGMALDDAADGTDAVIKLY